MQKGTVQTAGAAAGSRTDGRPTPEEKRKAAKPPHTPPSLTTQHHAAGFEHKQRERRCALFITRMCVREEAAPCCSLLQSRGRAVAGLPSSFSPRQGVDQAHERTTQVDPHHAPSSYPACGILCVRLFRGVASSSRSLRWPCLARCCCPVLRPQPPSSLDPPATTKETTAWTHPST
jgi:hypothetical protein